MCGQSCLHGSEGAWLWQHDQATRQMAGILPLFRSQSLADNLPFERREISECRHFTRIPTAHLKGCFCEANLEDRCYRHVLGPDGTRGTLAPRRWPTTEARPAQGVRTVPDARLHSHRMASLPQAPGPVPQSPLRTKAPQKPAPLPRPLLEALPHAVLRREDPHPCRRPTRRKRPPHAWTRPGRLPVR